MPAAAAAGDGVGAVAGADGERAAAGAANSDSNASTSGPRMYQPRAVTRAIASRTSSGIFAQAEIEKGNLTDSVTSGDAARGRGT
jgi:hypothetical protein